MKNVLVFILLLALITSQETYHISSLSDITCNPSSGKGTFDVKFEESNIDIGDDKEFHIIFASTSGSSSINAYCYFKDGNQTTTDEADDTDETTETILDDETSETDSIFKEGDVDSNEFTTYEAISDELTGENEIVSDSDEAEDSKEVDTDEETEKSSNEESTEAIKSENDSEESDSILVEDKDELDAEEASEETSSKQSSGLRRLNEINKKKKNKNVKKRRRLASAEGDIIVIPDIYGTEESDDDTDDYYSDNSSDEYAASCYFDSPKYSGSYTLDSVTRNDENAVIELKDGETITVDLIHCADEDEAQNAIDLHLSFRQVNSFETDGEGNGKFNLYGLTTEELDRISLYIEIYIITSSSKSSDVIVATCPSNETIEIPESGIAPVAFVCTFYSAQSVASIEIAGSESMAGFPTDESLLNPFLTDDMIKIGDLPNMSNPEVANSVPPVVEISDFNFDNAQTEGTFEIIANCESENLKVGQKFEFPLTFPSGIDITMTIKKISSSQVTFECLLDQDVKSQSLYFEPRTIIYEGKELFSLPGFKTEQVSIVKGGSSINVDYSDYYYDEDDETSDISDDETTETFNDEPAETSDDDNAETTIDYDETTETFNDEPDETSDDDKAETTIDESSETADDETTAIETGETTAIETGETTTDETGETTADETTETTTDEKEGTTEETNTDETSETVETTISTTDAVPEPQTDMSLEDAELAANITLSFRQVNSFEMDEEGNGKFNLYGLTTEKLDKFSFILEIYLFTNSDTDTQKTEVDCSNSETIEIPESGIAPVAFECTFYSTEQVISLEIAESDSMVGFPTDESLLNPVLTDEMIMNGDLPNMSDPEVANSVPPVVEIEEFNFDNIENEGTFEIIANIAEESSNIFIGQRIEIPLTYPSYINIILNIINIDGLSITFECEVEGEVDNMPLIFEQRGIVLDRKELFVLPGFKTEEITTSGIGVASDETSSQNATSSDEVTSEETTTDETGEATTDETGEATTDETGEATTDETGETTTDETGETTTDEAGETTTDEKEGTTTDETGEATTDETGEATTDETGETTTDEAGETKTDETGETTDETSETAETTITTTDVVPEPQTDMSLEDAELAANITLSFRQVNSFEIDEEGNGKFNLYGLTTDELDKFSFILEIYLFINGDKAPEKTEVDCSNSETIEIPESGISPVAFECSFTSTEQVTSIEIAESDSMVGFPTDESLLNPVLTDEMIMNGELPNMSDPEVANSVPPVVEIEEFNFDNIENEGTFEIIANLGEESSNLEEGQKIEIPLTYPSYIDIILTIIKIDGLSITFECGVDGEVDNMPLIFEQRGIIFEGKELFVLPGFKTEEITTSGIAVASDETSSQNATSSDEITSEETTTETSTDETSTEESTKETTTDETSTEESTTETSTDETSTEESTKETTTDETSTEESTKETRTDETSTEESTKETRTDETSDEESTTETSTEESTKETTTDETSDEESTTETSTDETTTEESTKETTTDETSTEESTETTTDETSTEESTKETSTDETSTEESTTETSTDETSTEESTKETSTDETSTEESTKETTTDETNSEEASTDTTSDETTTEESTTGTKTDESTSEESSDEQSSSDEATSEETTSDEASSEESSTNATTTDEYSSDETTSEETTTDTTTTEETTTDTTTTEETTTDTTATEETSTDTTATEETSTDTTTTEETSSDEATSEETSTDETTSEETSSDETASDETTSDETTSDTATSSDTSSESDTADATSSTESADTTSSAEQVPSDRPTFVIESDVITIEEAETLLNISLSFRQLKEFQYSSGVVSFTFVGLTSQSITSGHTITISVNLIPESGEMEEESKDAECTIASAVSPSEGQTLSAVYQCKVENLEEVYTSLRFNSSSYIAGVPTDNEVALNPVLTAQAIENNEVVDAEEAIIPPTFVMVSEDHSECSSSGRIVIKGTLSEDKSIVTKFTIPLTYPEGISITCSFDTDTLDCKLDRDLMEPLLIEQIIIKDGTKELFILQSIKIEGLSCGNGVLKDAEEKIDVDISFRQVSTIQKVTNGFTFFFAAFVNNRLTANSEIIMKMILLLQNGVETEKNATCVLRETVSPSNGNPIQGDFDCSVSLTDEEESNVTDSYELSVSSDNDGIGGCADLTEQEKSPRLTDEAIAESEEKADDSLAKVLDFSIAENKEYRPPTFEVSSFNLSSCESTGKFKVKGTFSDDIAEELTFNLPFSYPSSEIKCTVKNVTKDEEIEVKCKVQKGFRRVKSFVLEPRLIKKKCVEKLYIKGNKGIELNEEAEFKCENFNDIKKQKATLRQKNAHFSFLQLSRPVTKTHRFFFMALRRRVASYAFAAFTIKVRVHVRASSLRMLQEGETLDLGDVEVQCNLDQSSGDSGSFGCSPSVTLDASPAEIEIDDDDDQIVGAPDEIEVQTNPTIDLTELANLQAIEELPSVNITNITSLNCSYTGQYSIIGDLEDVTGQLTSFNKSKSFVVPFANPDSQGVCKISSLTDSSIELLCENTDEFSPTQVMISSQVINDANGKPLFKIVNDKTAANLFGCAISENSTLPTADEETEETDESDSESSSDASNPTTSDTSSTEQNAGIYHRNASSGGLSGGAIAGIIVACVAVLIAVAVLVGLVKKGVLGGRKVVTPPVDNSTTINRFNYAEGQN